MKCFFKFILIVFFVFTVTLIPAFSKEETEPNNTKKEANFISPGEGIVGHTGMKGEHGFTGDIDIFSFKADYAGKITVYASVLKKYGNVEEDASIRIDILNDEDLNAGAWKDPSSGKVLSPVFTENKTSARAITIGKGGMVYLKVDRCGGDAYYKFTVIYQSLKEEETATPGEAISETEPNDIASQANFLPLRQPVTGHTGKIGTYGLEGNKDYYRVEVPSPGKLTVFVTVTGKYNDSETGQPSLRLSIANGEEMASGDWKNPDTGKDMSPVFYKGTAGRCIFIKYSGEVILFVDRYEANAKYKLTVIFQGEK